MRLVIRLTVSLLPFLLRQSSTIQRCTQNAPVPKAARIPVVKSLDDYDRHQIYPMRLVDPRENIVRHVPKIKLVACVFIRRFDGSDLFGAEEKGIVALRTVE